MAPPVFDSAVAVRCASCSTTLCELDASQTGIVLPRARDETRAAWVLLARSDTTAGAAAAICEGADGKLTCAPCASRDRELVAGHHLERSPEGQPPRFIRSGRAEERAWRLAAFGTACALELSGLVSRCIVSGPVLAEAWQRREARVLVDLRDRAAFDAQHLRGASNVPWAHFEWRVAQLPVAAEPILLLAPGEAREPEEEGARRGGSSVLEAALLWMQSRGRVVLAAACDDESLWTTAASLSARADIDGADDCDQPRLLASAASGSRSTPAWRPSPLLEARPELFAPPLPPPPAVAIDVGCGSGRDAVALAIRGWHVIALDEQAPALARVRALAASEDVPVCEATSAADVASAHRAWEAAAAAAPAEQLSPALSPGPRSGSVVCMHLDCETSEGECALEQLPRAGLVLFGRYLHRPLLAWASGHVEKGGSVAIAHFLRGAELVGRRQPRLDKHLLERGELERTFGTGLMTASEQPGEPPGELSRPACRFSLLHLDENVQAEDGRPMAHCVAQRVS